MKLSRTGMYRNLGPSTLFHDKDQLSVNYSTRPGISGEKIVVRIRANRPEKSSYYYELELSPVDILRIIFTLPPSSLTPALHSLSEDFNLSKVIPAIIQGLAAGAITAPRFPDDEDDEDEDEEQEEEVDDDTDEDEADA